ncbi:MAG: TolB family protein [bacterium]
MRKLFLLLMLLPSIMLSSQTISLRMFDDMSDVMYSSSEHFTYTYKKELSDIVPEIAKISEGVYDTLSDLMHTRVRTKINLIITDQSDVPNGSSSPLLNPMVNIYLANPDPTFIAKHGEWVEYVLTHELTHALHLSATRPSCLSITRNSLFYAPNAAYPMYFLEGYAVYNESILGRGRMKDTKYEALLRTMLLDSAKQPVGNASSYFNRFFPYSELPYLYGPYILDKYREKYNTNPDRLTRLDFCSLLPFSVAFPDLLARANMGTFPSDALDDVYKDIEKRTDNLKSNMIFNERTKLTEFGFDNSLPSCFDNKLYYIKSFPHREKRFVARENDEETELFKVTYSTHYSVRNNKIYIDMLDVYDNTNYFFDMYEYDIKESKLEKLKGTKRGFGGDAFGDTLLFIRNQFNKQKIIVYSISKRLAVDSFSLGEDFKYYTISAKDEKNILISCYREGGFTDIVLYDMTTKEIEFLTSDLATDHSPQWSVNNNGFYFISDRSKVNAVYFYDLASKKIRKIYNSLYNVSSYSVDEENNIVYVQDISGNGDDIYSSKVLEQNEEEISLEEIVIPASLKKQEVTLKENGKYILPRFSGPGAYAFLPFILPDPISSFAIMGLPFIGLNSDISQALTLYYSTMPTVLIFGTEKNFIYPSYIELTSSHFENDIAFQLSFNRVILDNEYEGLKSYLPNDYQVSLIMNFERMKPFTGFYMTPAISYRKAVTSVFDTVFKYTSKGISFETGISDYESSILSITPSKGFVASSEWYVSQFLTDTVMFDYGISLKSSFYMSPVWNFNLFLNANFYYSRSGILTQSPLYSFMNVNDLMPLLSFTPEEDGLSNELYIRDFSYIKAGFVKPIMFINRGIPFKFMESLPVRFDYLSVSLSQLAGYNFYEKKREFVSRASVNLCVNMSILSIYPGLVVTYNEELKRLDFGITATIK